MSRTRPAFLLVFTLLAQSVFAQETSSPQALAQSPPVARKALPPRTLPPAVSQEQFVAYWTSETGWSSELQLRNNAVGQDLAVTPVLRLPDGTETPLAPVTVKP